MNDMDFHEQESIYMKDLARMIEDGILCANCHDFLPDDLPCLNCKRKDHLKALLHDALSMLGVNPDLAKAILITPKSRRTDRKAAATILREHRSRWR